MSKCRTCSSAMTVKNKATCSRKGCSANHHLKCVGVTQAAYVDTSATWLCPDCKNKCCYGCCEYTEEDDRVICTEPTCSLVYHYQCVGLKAGPHAAWKCPSCKANLPKSDNTNTPVKYYDDSFVNLRSGQQRHAAAAATTTPQDIKNYLTEARLRDILKQEMAGALRVTIKEFISAELKSTNDLITGLTDSMNFFNEQFENMKVILGEHSNTISALKIENENLKSEVKDLSGRLTITEQLMRESNIEINGIPEHKSENLPNTIQQLTKIIGNPLEDSEILYATRVAKMNKDNIKPRAVVVKLSSPRQRDSVLAAVAKFNKANPKDKLSSTHLGFGGLREPVFVSEHLTPANKSLHAAARKKSKEVGYSFVWVRNGKIFARKDTTCQALLIRSEDTLRLMC